MNKIFTILFWGSIWGILETFFGWAMHLLRFQAVGAVIFPLAMVILILAYQGIGSRRGVFAVAIIAAAFKLINLMMPGDIERVIVPFSCILVEGAVCAIIVPYLRVVLPEIKLKSMLDNIRPTYAFGTFVIAILIQFLSVIDC